jgi:hypothetical protein
MDIRMESKCKYENKAKLQSWFRLVLATMQSLSEHQRRGESILNQRRARNYLAFFAHCFKRRRSLLLSSYGNVQDTGGNKIGSVNRTAHR